MCVAVPGRLIEIIGGRGMVDIRGNILPVELGIVNAGIGDYLLIHAGCAISVVSRSEAEELDELLTFIKSYEK